MRRLSLALALAATTGCFLPTLQQLEEERPRTCNAEHGCLEGSFCVGGVCRVSGSTECAPEDSRPCGEARGECRQGVQACDGGFFDVCTGAAGPGEEVCDGKDNDCDGAVDEDALTSACELNRGVCQSRARVCSAGAPEPVCTATSYGALYEVTEISCDGADNDCDGQTDEVLAPQPCALTLGVCAGSERVCSGGVYPSCTAAQHQAHHSGYQQVETRCDGLDNDCDGLTDSSPPGLVADAGVLSRNVAAIVRPGTGSAQQRDVLVMYESGSRVVSRVLFADGGASGERFPSTSVASAVTRAALPALASSGPNVFQAWFEVLGGPLYRVVVAAAGPLGQAPGGSVYPVGTQAGPGRALALAASPERVLLAVSALDGPSASTSSLNLVACPATLNAACFTVALGAGSNPTLLFEGSAALIAWDSPAGLHLAKVNVPSTGAPTLVSNLGFGVGGDHDPVLTGTLSALSIYSAAGTSPQTLVRRAGDCTATCDPASFVLTGGLVTFDGVPSDFGVESRLSPSVMAWEEGPVSQRVAQAMNLATLTPAALSVESSHRPLPLLSGTGGYSIFFDTEGATGPQANAVVVRHFCGP